MKTRGGQLETVYRENCTAVYHTALSFLGDPAAAEDVMHDVFLTYYEQLEKEIPIRSLRAWLLTVTRNRCRNTLRNSSREYPEETLPEKSVEDPTIQHLHEFDAIQQLLSCLTADEKLAFSLHYLDGYTYRELSIGLEIPIGTLQTRCHIARKKLRQALKQSDTVRKEASHDISTVSESVSRTTTSHRS